MDDFKKEEKNKNIADKQEFIVADLIFARFRKNNAVTELRYWQEVEFRLITALNDIGIEDVERVIIDYNLKYDN
ncbi:hypothetical protein QNH20_10060 [Neobacillus sp. WH10]|uniref:hypothetical protein n=1 Tax=Neobacillus sp. WH10 TaxID=3047873 RepID=UPI0024C1FA5B|nr:hypothetical protein [Neobacillus sp. WH10]WHY79453.1 hypothetical protein QNH20_10060 [Neobacillus sp. WH10]